MSDDDNIIQFGQIVGGKEDTKEFPSNPYVLVDVDDNEYIEDGFLVFTTHHVCIMVEGPDGDPITGIMIPLSRLKFSGIIDDTEETIN